MDAMRIAAQAAAVAYLSKRAAAGSTSATRALLQCAGDEPVFCRVRSDAAVALSSSARDGTQRANLAHTGVARAYRRVGAPIGPLYRLSHPGDRDRPETTSARERLARNAPVSTRRTTRSAPDAVSSRDICR